MTDVENSLVAGADDEMDRLCREDPDRDDRVARRENMLSQGVNVDGYSFADVLLEVFEDDRYERAIQEVQRELPMCELSRLILEHSHKLAEEAEDD